MGIVFYDNCYVYGDVMSEEMVKKIKGVIDKFVNLCYSVDGASDQTIAIIQCIEFINILTIKGVELNAITKDEEIVIERYLEHRIFTFLHYHFGEKRSI